MKIFGIDLGTTYSCIAFVNEYGAAEVVPNAESQTTTPSVVAFEEGGTVSVGDAAKETLNTDPDNVCSTIKRQMGKRDFTFYAFDQEYTPEAISAIILKKIAKDAGEALGEEVKDVVITCPAYFGLEEREATKKAGIAAGLNVLAILNEPTAAAISYGIKTEEPQTVMVYDLGGGTFDVTIIKVENNSIRVVATGGDHMMGGKDWDEKISSYVIEQSCQANGESVDSVYADNELMGDLELKSEKAKKQLSQKDSVKVKFNGETVEISRSQFDQFTSDLLESTITKTHETMLEAEKKGVDHYDKILLVGGSTRMPQVDARLKQEFPNIPVEFCDPDQSVAKGAAMYGLNMAAFAEFSEKNNDGDGPNITKEEQQELRRNVFFGSGSQTKPITIKNVISQCIAVELKCEDDKLHIVNQIYKNTEIPCEHVLCAGTEVANQTTVEIKIFENASTDEYVDEELCKPLVDGILGPLPSGLPAGAPIDVVFKIDENGLLSIDAEHKPSGAVKHLEVNLQNALSQEELQEEIAKVNALHI